jgi:hypothetical protein
MAALDVDLDMQTFSTNMCMSPKEARLREAFGFYNVLQWFVRSPWDYPTHHVEMGLTCLEEGRPEEPLTAWSMMT